MFFLSMLNKQKYTLNNSYLHDYLHFNRHSGFEKKKKKFKKVKKRQKRKKNPTQQTTDVDQSVSVFYKRAVWDSECCSQISISHLSQAVHHPDSFVVLLWVSSCFLCICWFPITWYKVFLCDFILSRLTRSKTILYSTASWIGWPMRGLHNMSFYCRYHKRIQSTILPEYNYHNELVPLNVMFCLCVVSQIQTKTQATSRKRE